MPDPMTTTDAPPTPQKPIKTGIACKACDWPIDHLAYIRGLCPRCGRYVSS